MGSGGAGYGIIEPPGTVVRLEGLQGERGTLARQLARFSRGREVICVPSDTPAFQRCRIGNYNLSAIILAADARRRMRWRSSRRPRTKPARPGSECGGDEGKPTPEK